MKLQMSDRRLQIYCVLIRNLKFNLQSEISNLKFLHAHV